MIPLMKKILATMNAIVCLGVAIVIAWSRISGASMSMKELPSGSWIKGWAAWPLVIMLVGLAVIGIKDEFWD